MVAPPPPRRVCVGAGIPASHADGLCRSDWCLCSLTHHICAAGTGAGLVELQQLFSEQADSQGRLLILKLVTEACFTFGTVFFGSVRARVTLL